MAISETLRPSFGQTASTVPTRRFRHDIEGLRAIAVIFVLIWHAAPGLLPGGFVGVDVFFVISGFLMTQILVESFALRPKTALRDFYVRRAKRILPAACLVLTVSAILTWLVLPPTRWMASGLDILAAAAYVVNWRFADQAVNYLFADELPSVVQHFWSLAVEEQFYVFWPLALLAVFRICRSLNRHPASAVAAVAILSFLGSFAWSVYLTGASSGRAYFVTTTRLWELMLGALVALYAVHLERATKRMAAGMAWAGLAAILVSGVVLSKSTPFPGSAALLPTVGTAMIIAWGFRAAEAGPAKFLSVKPMMWIGALSYSIYLWHWPLLVFAGSMFGGPSETLTPAMGLLVVAVSVLPAWVSYKAVEVPLRRNLGIAPDRVDALQVGLALMLVSALAGIGLSLAAKAPQPSPPITTSDAALPAATATTDTAETASASPRKGQPQDEPKSAGTPTTAKLIGARLLGDDPRSSPYARIVESPESIVPNPLNARLDIPAHYGRGCHVEMDESDARACSFGDPNADITIALVGDSHAAQYLPALDIAAKEHGWRIASYTKSSCLLIDAQVMTTASSEYKTCTEWNQRVRDKLVNDPSARPDYLLVSSSLYLSFKNKENFAEALESTWKYYQSAGIPVVVLLDSPQPQPRFDVAACVSSNLNAMSKCTFDRDAALQFGSLVSQKQAATRAGAPVIDLFDWICPGSKCAPVIGGILVYRDNNHITATYAATLDQQLGKRMKEIVAQKN